MDLNLRKKLEKCYSYSIALFGAEIWTLRKVDHSSLEMEKINCTDCMRNEGVLHGVREIKSYMQYKEGRLIGLVTSCIETA